MSVPSDETLLRTGRIGLVSTAILSLVFAASAEEAKIEANLTAFAVSVNSSGEEVLQQTSEIDPGEVIEYQMDYRNVSDESLSGLVISGDVPDATAFISAGDLEQQAAVFEVQVEGIGWSMLPVFRYEPDEAGVLRPVQVPLEEFEAVRWRVTEALSPGQEVSVSYRIKVDS